MIHKIWLILCINTKHLFRYRFQYQMKRLSKQVWTVSANVHFTAKNCFSGTFDIFYSWSRAFRTWFLTSRRICFDSSERKWWNNEPLRLTICQKCGTVCLFNHTVCYYYGEFHGNLRYAAVVSEHMWQKKGFNHILIVAM